MVLLVRILLVVGSSGGDDGDTRVDSGWDNGGDISINVDDVALLIMVVASVVMVGAVMVLLVVAVVVVWVV